MAQAPAPITTTRWDSSSSLNRFIRDIEASDMDLTELLPHETFWRDHQPWLAQRGLGYQLRSPFYSPTESVVDK